MPDMYAVMGNPVSHSKSPFIHHEFAKYTKQDIQYSAIEVPLNQFATYVENFKASGGRGLNITLPFKQQAFELVDECNEFATIAEAVNTIQFTKDKLLGFNTDGIGLVRDLQENYKVEITGRRILVLGAGGAVRGVLFPLLNENPSEILIANRTETTAVNLAKKFSTWGNITAIRFDDLEGQKVDLIINGTSSSITAEQLNLPTSLFCSQTFCYDMMYSSTLTSFLQQSIRAGCQYYADGIGMLIEQAAEAFFIWRGIRPPTESLLKKLRAKNTA